MRRLQAAAASIAGLHIASRSWKVGGEQVANCRHAGCELQVGRLQTAIGMSQVADVQFADCNWKRADCELQIANCNRRIGNAGGSWETQTATKELQVR